MSNGFEYGYVAPYVRGMAAKMGVDATRVAGSGENGRVLMRDVEAAAETVKAAAAASAASAAVASPVAQVLQVAPRSAAEMAAALGPRPGDDWFPEHPMPQDIRPAQEWDRQVRNAATYDELLDAAAREHMARLPGLTLAEAMADVQALGDCGPNAG